MGAGVKGMSGSEDSLLPGGGNGSFAPGATSLSRHPPLIKNPFVLVKVKSNPKLTPAISLTARLVF